MENKTDATLQILSIVPEEERMNTAEYLQLLGFDNPNNWQIIVKYNGDIERVVREQGGIAQIINEQYALITVPPANIRNLLNYTEVEYIETSKRMVYTVTNGMEVSCITSVQNNPPYNLKGEGVLLGMVDSGINYAHPDFRNEDGTTRITSIWDQGIPGNPPAGFVIGSEYTREQMNEALRAPTREEGLAIVPSQDTNGHGTHVAGIAGGNGRGSNGRVVGAAPSAEFIIVKLAQPGGEDFVRSSEIMLAVKYIIEKARELGRPVAINISIGMNSGPHDGQSLLEQYLDDMATLWRTNIVVGTGNEGNARSHTRGVVQEGKSMAFQFQIGPNTFFYNLSLWKSFIDTFEFEIISPSGSRTPRIIYAQGPVQYRLGNTQIYAAFAGPSPLNGDEEFAVFMTGVNGGTITSGPWAILIYGVQVLNGSYNVWGPTVEAGGQNSFMLEPIVETSLTTPSTARLVISVGAYDSVSGQMAPFSGRGFARNASVIKPDLVAPGVDILAPSNQGTGYRTLSGTSMATPHVTGGVALLMEWGIVQGNNVFLYGENLKTYLLRGANRNIPNETFPNTSWGYGKLCVRNSLDLLRRQQIF